MLRTAAASSGRQEIPSRRADQGVCTCRASAPVVAPQALLLSLPRSGSLWPSPGGRSGRKEATALRAVQARLVPEGTLPVGRVAAVSSRSPCRNFLLDTVLYPPHLMGLGLLFCGMREWPGGRPQNAPRSGSVSDRCGRPPGRKALAPLALSWRPLLPVSSRPVRRSMGSFLTCPFRVPA
jgi:hypothetical protein